MRIAAAALGGLLLLGGVASGVDNTGYDPSQNHEWVVQPTRQCSVFMFGDAMGEASRFSALGFIVTVGADLSYANISQYDVVVIPLVAPGVIGGWQGDIEQFVDGGGGLFIHQPNAIGLIDYAPTGFEFTETNNFWCDPPDQNQIVDTAHPTMAGLANADLAGRFDQVSIGALGTGYGLIAKGIGACENDVCCAGGCYGAGRVFLDLSNLSSGSIDPGADLYVVNVLDWLCDGGASPATETTWGAVKSAFAE
jgi:hypothetical protein